MLLTLMACAGIASRLFFFTPATLSRNLKTLQEGLLAHALGICMCSPREQRYSFSRVR